MTRATIVASIVMALATRASAGIVVAPEGWFVDDARADAVRAKAAETKHFGGVTTYTTSAVYVAPRPGVVLYTTQISLAISTDPALVALRPADRDAAARAEVDELHATTRRAALTGLGIREDAWHERVDPTTNTIEARLSWHDQGAEIVELTRMVIASDATFMVVATAECIANLDQTTPKETAALVACRAALETLDAGIPPAKRVALGLAPSGTVPTPTSTPTAIPHSTNGRPPAKLDDGSRTALPPTPIPQRPTSPDRRPVFVGGGLVVLAAVFWWNRRRRERFEREDEESHDR